MVCVVGSRHLDGRDVTAVFLEAVVVEPVDPFGGGVLDLVHGAPRFAWFDQLGLIQPVDGLGQGVVIRASDRTDRGLDACFGKNSVNLTALIECPRVCSPEFLT
jgi:hypothetical protein